MLVRMLLILCLKLAVGAHSATASELVEHTLQSEVLKDTLISIEPTRRLKVLLPTGYEESSRAYPVVYYLHSFFWDNERLFEDGRVQDVLTRAMNDGTIEPFILVAPDFRNSNIGSFYQNNAVSGRWLDHLVEEVIPYIDRTFRTLPTAASRGVTGSFIGGYGAIKVAMVKPGVFGSVYALHPVGTGLGTVPMVYRPDWEKMSRASSYEDLEGDSFSTVFMAMAQAYSPNANRPPMYADLMVDYQGEERRVNPEVSESLRANLLLDRYLPEYAHNLKALRGFMFDWARYDLNQDHVFSNQYFARLLEEYGVEHQAEEYRGDPFSQNWTEYGRVYDDMLPFFSRHLVFGARGS